jgi:ppGpp synthetase/RelA/SpoT-type nucleotidyltranferase
MTAITATEEGTAMTVRSWLRPPITSGKKIDGRIDAKTAKWIAEKIGARSADLIEEKIEERIVSSIGVRIAEKIGK